MYVILTNNTMSPLPVVSSDGPGLAETIETGQPYPINNDDINVVIVGDKPGFLESLVEGLQKLGEIIGRILTAWRERNDALGTEGPRELNVQIENRGTTGIRVCLGSNTDDVEVGPNATYQATAPGYLELRELGV